MQMSFLELVEATVTELEGSFALIFKSRLFPGEVRHHHLFCVIAGVFPLVLSSQLVATRRGSPLLIGVKTDSTAVDNIPIFLSSKTSNDPQKSSTTSGLKRFDSWNQFLSSGI